MSDSPPPRRSPRGTPVADNLSGNAFRSRAKHLFAKIDTNSSGRINGHELSAAMKHESVKRELCWPGTAEQLLHLLTPSGSGGFALDSLVRYFEVLELFGMIDDNNSGRINPYELKRSLQTNPVVREKLAVPPNLAPTLFSQIDTNGSGAVSFVEFFRHFTAAPLSKPFKPLGDHTAITEALFKKIDSDGSGSITKSEFIRALKQDREVQLELGWPAHMAEHLFAFLDQDKSGDVSREEFKLFCKAQWLFNSIDVNRSGYIDAYELGVALANPSMQSELRCRVEQAKDVFTKMDTEGSGMVKFSAFYRYLAKLPQRAGYTAAPRQAIPQRKEDQYQNIKRIGEGAFGDVYLVRHYSGETLIKKVPKLQERESDEELAERMQEVLLEAKALQEYKHPNVVRYFDSWEEKVNGKNVVIIITEFCSGGDLRGYMVKHPQIPRSMQADIFYQLCCAIEFLHRGRLLHRDLKPDNVFLTGRTDRPIVKVGDFGLVKQLGQAQNTAKTMCGTLHYMAPELLSDQGYGMANDVWALGCILYEVATGQLAFRNVADIVKGKLPQDTPQWCSQTVLSALILNPKDRPSVSELKHAFVAANRK